MKKSQRALGKELLLPDVGPYLEARWQYSFLSVALSYGLFDADGDLAAYKTFLPKGKDEDVPMEFNMDEVF